MNELARAAWLALGLCVCGCQNQDASQASLPPPEVTIATPSEQEVIDYERFTGKTEPVEQVDVRAKVSGYLVKSQFQPGSEVKKGDLLFEIDPRSFKASLDGADAQKAAAEAGLKLAKAEYERARKLASQGAASREEMEVWAAKQSTAAAESQKADANIEQAKLDLGFTKITAPIGGRVGDRLVDEGNLVIGGQGNTSLLTTIVAVDPMAVSFDLNENTLQRLQEAVREGRIQAKEGTAIPVEMGLSIHGSAYPLKGMINFVNNRVDPKTGTIRVKAEFPNPKPSVGSRVLTPGMFVRLRVPIGQPHKALLVPEAALGTDQGRKFLYTVNDHKAAVRLEATVGGQQNGLRVIEQVQGAADAKPRSLRADEPIIVKGLQRVRPGMTVDPKPAKQ